MSSPPQRPKKITRQITKGPTRLLGLRTVVLCLLLSYNNRMKLLLLVSLFVVPLLPLAAEPAPLSEPVWSVYTSSAAVNSRRAIRLGYQNFHTRVNTPDMTPTDTQIALLITTKFQPFFDKLQSLDEPDRQAQADDLQDEFEALVTQLAILLFKNQHRYTNPLFLQDQPAFDETLSIVQEAIDKGSF